jgi:hypothetical protein
MEMLLKAHAELGTLIGRLQRAENLNRHYERVLRQAVLTHGGKLTIDPARGEEAIKSTAELWIGGGGVTFYETGKGFSDSSGLPKQPLGDLDTRPYPL